VGTLRRNNDFDQHPIWNIIRPLTDKTGKKERKKEKQCDKRDSYNCDAVFPIHDGLTEEAGCEPGEACLTKVSLMGCASLRYLM
jgi:hypothetical protein